MTVGTKLYTAWVAHDGIAIFPEIVESVGTTQIRTKTGGGSERRYRHSQIGKSVFLTPAEAVASIKRRYQEDYTRAALALEAIGVWEATNV